MPAPQFVPLTLDECRKLVERFDFSARQSDAVHMHHTWRPRQVELRGLASILGMWKYHIETNGWSDIAQHVTIDPQGIIWTGRSWKQPPASSGGHNGTSRVGPFMFEQKGIKVPQRAAFRLVHQRRLIAEEKGDVAVPTARSCSEAHSCAKNDEDNSPIALRLVTRRPN